MEPTITVCQPQKHYWDKSGFEFDMLNKQILPKVSFCDITSIIISDLLNFPDVAKSSAFAARSMHFFWWPTGSNNAASSRI